MSCCFATGFSDEPWSCHSHHRTWAAPADDAIVQRRRTKRASGDALLLQSVQRVRELRRVFTMHVCVWLQISRLSQIKTELRLFSVLIQHVNGCGLKQSETLFRRIYLSFLKQPPPVSPASQTELNRGDEQTLRPEWGSVRCWCPALWGRTQCAKLGPGPRGLTCETWHTSTQHHTRIPPSLTSTSGSGLRRSGRLLPSPPVSLSTLGFAGTPAPTRFAIPNVGSKRSSGHRWKYLQRLMHLRAIPSPPPHPRHAPLLLTLRSHRRQTLTVRRKSLCRSWLLSSGAHPRGASAPDAAPRSAPPFAALLPAAGGAIGLVRSASARARVRGAGGQIPGFTCQHKTKCVLFKIQAKTTVTLRLWPANPGLERVCSGKGIKRATNKATLNLKSQSQPNRGLQDLIEVLSWGAALIWQWEDNRESRMGPAFRLIRTSPKAWTSYQEASSSTIFLLGLWKLAFSIRSVHGCENQPHLPAHAPVEVTFGLSCLHAYSYPTQILEYLHN